jgi:hypothetical protein
MLDEASSAPIIDRALERLAVAPAGRPALASRIVNVSIVASFRPPPPGKRITPKQIVEALERIETGLRDVSAGLMIIDGARSSAGLNAHKRNESLAAVQRAILGAIAEAVVSRIQGCSVTDEQLAASMPEYGYLAFKNSWRGAFGDAAHRVANLRNVFDQDDFRSPSRDREEWFVRAVGQLAEIYEDATGNGAKAYSRGGDATNPAWRPPFAQFVVDLWPMLGFGAEKAPSDRRIADALADAPNLPPMGEME